MERMSFKQFILTFNFRNCVEANNSRGFIEDTHIIRIFPPMEIDDYDKDNWIDFGTYDFTSKEYMWNRIIQIFQGSITLSYVETIQFNWEDNSILEIHLSKEKGMED